MIHWFLKTKLFIPKAHEESVFTIDYKTLYEEGKRVLLIDVDNTLIPYDETHPNQKMIQLFKTLKTIGFETIIISNNSTKRIKTFSDALKVPYVASAKKPLKWGFKKAQRLTEQFHEKDEILVIGDQLMTDVYGAKRSQLECILVTPIKKRSEKWYTKFNRLVENKMLKKIKRKYPRTYQALHLETRING